MNPIGLPQGSATNATTPASDLGRRHQHLISRSDVDSDRIGGLGVCASSGYQAHSAATDARVKALGFIAPWLHDRELVGRTAPGY